MARLAIHGFWNEPAAFAEPHPRKLSAIAWFAGAATLWVAFAAVAAFSPETLTSMWDSFVDWSLIGQVVVGILTLPWLAALWISQLDWDVWVRALAIVAIAGTNLVMFWPRARN